MSFDSRYLGLNAEQKKAVDTIDGPVMVIAGPGTGKTELLSMRAANILRLTDTSPSSILCITYTDNGAAAIRDRLIEIIGQTAYKVPIHTFHSLGLEIINQNPEYFYNGVMYQNSDDLTTYKILDKIFRELPHSDLLASRYKDDFTYLSDIKSLISEIKKSGLTGSELLKILDSNELTIQKTNQILGEIFASAPRINMKMVHAIENILPEIASTSTPTGIDEFKPLADIMCYYLQEAMEISLSTNKTAAVKEWRDSWMKKDNNKIYSLKATKNQEKLRSACNIYEKYLAAMDEEKLFDYDDMILRVVHACRAFPELRYNLQEKFQYIMIDEFQDTNIAQMRLIASLTDTLIDSEKPNIMIVGDDDQAIYSFQGADVSNIINFSHNYPGAEIINLVRNYRSTPEILKKSRKVIINGKDRLENHFTNLNKELIADKDSGMEVKIFQAENITDEKLWLVDSIKDKIENGTQPSNIAVLTRKHDEIEELIPYFSHLKIPFSYQRKNNILTQAPIMWIVRYLKIIYHLRHNRLDTVNGLMPEFIAHKSWGIEPKVIFELALEAKKNKTWIEVISEREDLVDLFQFIVEGVVNSANLNFEVFLDFVTGKDGGVSPFIKYFFNAEKRNENPEEYITFLNSLSTLRRKFRNYLPNNDLNLEKFLEFIELHSSSGTGIYLVDDYAGFDTGVRVMTAHSSKGLEYEVVYIFNTIDSFWGSKARSKQKLISYPENMPLREAGDKVDERIRLLYVAMTRAKNELNISYSTQNEKDKHTDLVEFLVEENLNITEIEIHKDYDKMIEIAEVNWYEPVFEAKQDLKSALKNKLSHYKLSATHFNNFLDVTNGGPERFLLQNLLKFPESKSPSSIYGSAVHEALKLAHEHMKSKKQTQATEDILANFEKYLKNEQMSDTDFAYYIKRGRDNLSVFFKSRSDLFKTNQTPELDFKDQNSTLGQARLTGKLDVFEKNGNSLFVTDYKTGKSLKSWKGEDDYEKIKLHKYRQQLIFYKILLENSRDYYKYKFDRASVTFVEPDLENNMNEISLDFSSDEVERTKKLIEVVWQHIIDLNLPDTSSYGDKLAGILAFEKDLLEGKI